MYGVFKVEIEARQGRLNMRPQTALGFIGISLAFFIAFYFVYVGEIKPAIITAYLLIWWCLSASIITSYILNVFKKGLNLRGVIIFISAFIINYSISVIFLWTLAGC